MRGMKTRHSVLLSSEENCGIAGLHESIHGARKCKSS